MKILQGILIMSAITFFFPLSLSADGNMLLNTCLKTQKYFDTGKVTIDDYVDIGYCMGLGQGVRQTMQIIGDKLPVNMKACFPENEVTNNQATRVIVSYLKKNPIALHRNETLLIMLAYKDAYPCK